MQKLLLISAVFPPEPVVSARLSFDLAEMLSKRFNVTVFCPLPTRPAGFCFKSEANKAAFEIVRSDSYTCPESKIVGRLKESYSFGKAAAKYIKQNSSEIDCIYANAWPLFSQKMVVKAAKKYRIPCILHVHDIYPESLTYKMNTVLGTIINVFMRNYDRWILNNASKVVGISGTMIQYLSSTRHINKEKFVLVRNWQDNSIFNENISTDEKLDSFVFMYVGSVSPSAALPSLIKAFHKAAMPNTEMIIAGAGSEKNVCVKLADVLRVKCITFCEISPSDVPALQSKANVMLLPLKKKIATTATPSKLTSYLLSGKAVLACVENNTDAAEIITTAQCGLLAVPEDIEAIAIAMKKFRDIPCNEIQNMGQRGREFALQHMIREKNLLKLVKEIEELVL